MKKSAFGILLMASTMLAATSALAKDVTISIESWRSEDLKIWQDKILPAFEKSHPGIHVKFTPTSPVEYDAALNSRLAGGTAGDLITCRPFDQSLGLYKKGYLADISDLSALKNFPPVAKAAWSTDDGKVTFCVPMASVIHGFIYNKDAFKKLGIEPPKTEAEFFAMLEKIKKDGTYVPMAMGTHDEWEANTMGYYNIGPNYWKGEEGRLGLIKGTQKLTDPQWVAPFASIAKWRPYLGEGFEAQTYSDSQNMFTLGRAAIYPAGSWEISGFNAQADFKMGAFPPPLPKAGQTCYISDHTDIGMGMNAKTKHPEAAKAFLNWLGTAEFASLYSNALPGFFSLSKHTVELKDPLAQEFVSWRKKCKSTIRPTYQILSRGKPNLETEMGAVSAAVINGKLTPKQAAERLQKGLESWYKPQQKK